MKLTPTEGMRDYLPSENSIRDSLMQTIRGIYRANGFRAIETPAVESLENLENSDGGDNLKLIYRLEKRGQKLEKAIEAGDFANLCDLGLRYDLTLPLSRYYACHKNELETPFKTIQIGRVYRAERPQKGRLREFVQCDIDIIGSKAPECEIELILTTAEAIRKIGIGDFKIKINDRSLLRAVIEKIGFAEENFDSVCITFDKLDKIGADGVKAELLAKEFDPEVVDRFCQFFSVEKITMDDVRNLLGECDALKNVEYIMNSVEEIAGDTIKLEFDISLVRGQGYYTGTVFEIHSLEFSGAIGGGGRYDNLTGIFGMPNVSGVGISFGADRIYDVLSELNLYPENLQSTTQLLFATFGEQELLYALRWAKTLREKGMSVEVYPEPTKMKKQMGYADSKKIPFVAIVGGDEMAAGKVMLKDMQSGEQQLMTLEELMAKMGV